MTITRSLLCLIIAIVLAAVALLIATNTVHGSNEDAWALGSIIAFYCSFLP